MMKTFSLIISLMEVLHLVRQTYREYVLEYAQTHVQTAVLPWRTWELDPRPIVQALVQEINVMQAGSTETMGSQLQAHQLLMQAGMDADSATELTTTAFQLITDLICAYAPEASFGGDGEWSYAYVNECDLQVSCLYEDTLTHQPPLAERIVAMAPDLHHQPPPTAVPGLPMHWFGYQPEPLPAMITSAELQQRFEAEYGRKS